MSVQKYKIGDLVFFILRCDEFDIFDSSILFGVVTSIETHINLDENQNEIITHYYIVGCDRLQESELYTEFTLNNLISDIKNKIKKMEN